MVSDYCYHCGGSGKVDDETMHHDLMVMVCDRLASKTVDRMRENANDDPDGEGWAFRAAENMMSEYDYTRCLMWDKASEYGEKLSNLPEEIQKSLIELLVAPPRRVIEPAHRVAQPVPDTVPVMASNDDDIPF